MKQLKELKKNPL